MARTTIWVPTPCTSPTMGQRLLLGLLRRTSTPIRMSSTAAKSRKLEGKVAIVTASSEGIGFAIAKQLATDGAKVVVSSRNKDKVARAVAELEKEQGCTVTGVECHVGKPDHRKKLVEQTVKLFGEVDILVSNAAVNPIIGPVLQTSEDAWDKIFDVNVKSAFLLAKDVIPLMEKRGGGAVVFVTSIAGYHPIQSLGAYSVSKTALLGLTKVLANECAHMGVRVNGVAPGLIKTKFSEAFWKNDAFLEHTLQGIPLKRIGESEDISGAVSFLASDQASYITGETIPITGGFYSRL